MMTWAGSWGHSAISASRGLIRFFFGNFGNQRRWSRITKTTLGMSECELNFFSGASSYGISLNPHHCAGQ